jgi:hypothetical protein
VWGQTSLFGDSRADTPLTCPLLVRIRNGKGMSTYPEVGGVAKTEESFPNLLNLSTEYCGSVAYITFSVDEGALKHVLFFNCRSSLWRDRKNTKNSGHDVRYQDLTRGYLTSKVKCLTLSCVCRCFRLL